MILLDVRTAAEFQEKYLPDSKNIDIFLTDFLSKIDSLDRNKSYSVYCKSGGRSAKTKQLMDKLGFSKVKDMGSIENAATILDKAIVYG